MLAIRVWHFLDNYWKITVYVNLYSNMEILCVCPCQVCVHLLIRKVGKTGSIVGQLGMTWPPA